MLTCLALRRTDAVAASMAVFPAPTTITRPPTFAVPVLYSEMKRSASTTPARFSPGTPSDCVGPSPTPRKMASNSCSSFSNVEVGTAFPIEKLEQEFDAIFLGVGLGPTQSLGVPGENLAGVVDALRFISEYKTGTAKVGGRVIVVGAGNTAIDAATASVRLNAKEVSILYRRGEGEMPAFLYEYELAKQGGIAFHWLTQPVAILGERAVESVECVRMELGPKDSSGRRFPQPVAGSNFRLPADMVITSLGQSRLIAFLERVRGVKLQNQRVAITRETGQTSNPKYFAGGDCVSGGREVVDAVADGKRAAGGILASFGAL